MVSADTPTVFVVDDDADIRASIQDLLESAGLRSECFETAEQFLKRTPWHGPSCLILDVSLPGISGLDFQQQLRNTGLEIPIIFVAAHSNMPMTVRAMKSGALEFLTKPFEDPGTAGGHSASSSSRLCTSRRSSGASCSTKRLRNPESARA